MEYHSHHSPDRTSFFFFNDTSTTEIYTLSLHDALPICVIDTLYGGTGRLQTRIEGRDFSHTEQRVINRLVNVIDRKSTRLNSSHLVISYAVFCLKKNNTNNHTVYQSHDSSSSAHIRSGT